jgi:hypothetical protein
MKEAEMYDRDQEMIHVLEALLASDENITARAVARLHPAISSASLITRSEGRSQLLTEYQQRQLQYRNWRGRAGKRSGAEVAAVLEQQHNRIAELENNLEILISSHVAMVRSVGAIGGFAKWAEFFETYQNTRNALDSLGGLPDVIVTSMSETTVKSFTSTKKTK